MKNKRSFFIILSLFLTVSMQAKEVINTDIDKNLSMINLGVSKDISDATTMVKEFYEDFDIYTGFYQNRYYQYLVNIDPKLQTEALNTARARVPGGYFVNKQSFDYGVKLLDTVQEQNPVDEVVLDQKTQEAAKQSTQKLVQKSELEYEQDIPKGFVKVDLIDAILQTLSRSYKVKAARERMIQAKRNLEIAEADFKPSIDLGYYISGNRREPGDLANDGRYESTKDFQEERFTLTLDQNIYAGGESSAYLQKIQKEYLLAKNSYEGLIESEIAKTITAYFDIVFRRDALSVNEANISQLQKILEIVKVKFESGALSLGELSSVEASISNAMSLLSRTKSRYNNALEFYNYITGREFENTYPYQKDIDISIDDFETVKQKALQDNNRLKGFMYEIAGKQDSLEMAKSAFKPKIDLQLFAQRTLDEEDFEVDENEYTARLNFSYNLYNGGRDKAAFMKAFSSIQESNYEKEAEILELIWNLEKLHTSLMSLQESLKSIKDEVSSSVNMVDSYWEGFRYGEQDLYILLQAQRQLNSAQLQFIDSRQDSIIDFFKILEYSGGLIEYFGIDIESSDFLNMAQGMYHKRSTGVKATNKELSLLFSIEQEDQESNETKVENQPLQLNEEQKQDSLKQLLSYKEEFLMQEKDSFTIVFQEFDDIYDALTFINKNEIEKRAFVYKTFKNGKIKVNVAYEIYTSEVEAQKVMQSQRFGLYDKKSVMLVNDVQQQMKEFNSLLLVERSKQKTKIVQKVIKPQRFVTDQAFKQEFLNADENFFTINITTFQSLEDAAKVVNTYDIKLQSFVFSYGNDNELYKLMYGVYESYEEAKDQLQSLGLLKENFMPVIEKIGRKQKLYKRYNQQ